MSILDWFKIPEKTNKELQAELKALVYKCVDTQNILWDDRERYEELLKEIYLRGLEPEVKMKPKV